MTELVRVPGNAVTRSHFKSVHVDGEEKHKRASCPLFKIMFTEKGAEHTAIQK